MRSSSINKKLGALAALGLFTSLITGCSVESQTPEAQPADRSSGTPKDQPAVSDKPSVKPAEIRPARETYEEPEGVVALLNDATLEQYEYESPQTKLAYAVWANQNYKLDLKLLTGAEFDNDPQRIVEDYLHNFSIGLQNVRRLTESGKGGKAIDVKILGALLAYHPDDEFRPYNGVYNLYKHLLSEDDLPRPQEYEVDYLNHSVAEDGITMSIAAEVTSGEATAVSTYDFVRVPYTRVDNGKAETGWVYWETRIGDKTQPQG